MNREAHQKIGFIFFISVIGCLLLWDTAMQIFFGLKHTVSWAVWEAARSTPFFACGLPSLIIGGVYCHLFWSGHADAQKEKETAKKLFERCLPSITDAILRHDIEAFQNEP